MLRAADAARYARLADPRYLSAADHCENGAPFETRRFILSSLALKQ